MPFPRLDQEELYEVQRIFLNKFRRPNHRFWERYDSFTDAWVPATRGEVQKLLRAWTDQVSKVSGRPESHYQALYADLATMAHVQQREEWIIRLRDL